MNSRTPIYKNHRHLDWVCSKSRRYSLWEGGSSAKISSNPTRLNFARLCLSLQRILLQRILLQRILLQRISLQRISLQRISTLSLSLLGFMGMIGCSSSPLPTPIVNDHGESPSRYFRDQSVQSDMHAIREVKVDIFLDLKLRQRLLSDQIDLNALGLRGFRAGFNASFNTSLNKRPNLESPERSRLSLNTSKTELGAEPSTEPSTELGAEPSTELGAEPSAERDPSRASSDISSVSALITAVNQIYTERGIRLRINTINAWEINESKSASLITLATELKRDLNAKRRDRSRGELEIPHLILGLTATPPPSFAKLNDLRWATLNSPYLVVRVPQHYYRDTLSEALVATSRLLVQALAISMGAAPLCDTGWASATRDQLLGLQVSTDLSTSAPQSGRGARAPRANQATRQGAAQIPGGLSGGQETPRVTYVASSDYAWRFTPISWGETSARIIQARRTDWLYSDLDRSGEASCESFYMSLKQCPQDQLTQRFAQRCLSDQERLVEAHQRGLLQGERWTRERESALGITALRAQDYQRALDLCVPIAKHYPTLLASKCAGLAAQGLGSLEVATLYLRAYLSSHVDDVETISALAQVLGRRGLDRDAVTLLRALTTRYTDTLGAEMGRVYLNLGVGEARLGLWGRARAAWRMIKPKDENFERAQELLREFAKR